MFTLTVTLAGTQHQIVLSFKKLEDAHPATKSIDETIEGPIALKDGFGRTSYMKREDIISVVFEDVVAYWEGRSVAKMIKLRAEHAFERAIKDDPQLHFLAGHQHPKFGDL